jgi:type IX secretion system PorP/SprF family membrane protein
MKTFALLLLTFLICSTGSAQQTNRYTQYTLNNLGMNPAYAGSYQNKVEFMAGRRNQWYGFEGAPVSNFVSVSYGYRPNYSFKGWHGFSGYVEQDKLGVFTQKSAYLGYAYHIRLFKGICMSFGLMAGVRTFGITSGIGNPEDPAFANNKSVVRAYPDVIPGFRLYSKKMFLDISVKQLYVNHLKQGSKQIGTNDAKLPPHYYITYGRKIHTGYRGLIVSPSVHVQSSLLSLPQVDLNCMVYYHKRVGLGFNYRVNNSVSGILQVSILKNLVAGFAYDYTTTKFSAAAANSYELMIGISPVMSSDEKLNRNRVANCPTFDF